MIKTNSTGVKENDMDDKELIELMKGHYLGDFIDWYDNCLDAKDDESLWKAIKKYFKDVLL
ncbi:MAG: hypothetical protein WC309_01655 [Candidatus Paceibacterota bacterium]